MSGLLIRDARLLTLDPGIGEIARGWLRVEGRRIRDLGAGEAPPPGPEEKVLEGRDRLVMPGLINCHLHSHEHIHRGRFDNMPMEVWQHFVRPPGGFALGAEGVYLRTMIGILEMLRTGTTCAVDDVNHFPAYDEAEIEAVFRAYEDSGLRAAVSVSMLDRRLVEGIPYVRETFPEALLARIMAQPAPDRARLLEVASAWAARYADPAARVRFLVAPSAPSRCSDEFLLELQALAERLDLPFFTHLSETRIQIVTAQAFYGKRSLAQHLHDLGLLTPRLGAYHGVWLDEEDIRLVAEGGASVIHSPLSNLKLGSGIPPLRKMLDAGVNLALGCDGCGSNDSLNGFVNLRVAALLHKVTHPSPERWVGAAEALEMATLGGARALGLGDRLGRLAPGLLADLVVIDLSQPEYLPLNDAARQVVFCETGANVETVIVDGEIVFAEGRPTKIDGEALARDIRELHAALAPQLAAASRSAEEMRPFVERIYNRAVQEAGAWGRGVGPPSE